MALLVNKLRAELLGPKPAIKSSPCIRSVQESERLLGTVLSIQPRTGPAAGSVSSDDLVANMAQDILAHLPAPLLWEDASIAKDPFAILPTGVDSSKITGHMSVLTSQPVNHWSVWLCSVHYSCAVSINA